VGATSASGWTGSLSPATAASSDTSSSSLIAATLALGALLSLAYASWALTARRGIFSDFAQGRTVSVDEARSSDVLDTVLLVAAAVVTLAALVWWLSRMLTKRTTGDWVDKTGMVVSLLGATVVIVGLAMTNRVTSAAGQVAQGGRGVDATSVVATGFALLAVGLLMGIFAVGGHRVHDDGASVRPATGHQGW
jgi:hypothetical protein